MTTHCSASIQNYHASADETDVNPGLHGTDSARQTIDIKKLSCEHSLGDS